MIPVVIVSYNTRAIIHECLSSLRTSTLQTWPIVVDNGSHDGSVAMIEQEFPEALILEANENLGFARANNLALRQLDWNQHQYILFLNPDAILQPQALEQLVAFAEQHPRVGIVAPKLVYRDGSHQAAAFRFPSLLMTIFDLWPPRGPGFGRLYNHPLNGRYRRDGGEQPFAIDHPLGAAMLVRTAVLRDVGPFDDSFWLYAEEVEWCWRIRQAGWAIWQEPRASVIHIGGSSSSQFRVRSFLALQHARRSLFERIHGPTWNRAYRWLITLGGLSHTLTAVRDFLSGQIEAAELRRRSWSWAMAQRKLSEAPWIQVQGERNDKD